MTDEEKTSAIRAGILAAGKKLKHRYPVLRRQNAWGMTFFLVSVAMILGAAWCYLSHRAPAWAVILWIAFWTSILHELEHDLIHYLYFKKQPRIQNLMLLGLWLLRPLTLNPWMRRRLHFHHHKYSGTETDMEEKGVTNGMSWGILRLLATPDLFFGNLLRYPGFRREVRDLYRTGKLSEEDTLHLRRTALLGFLPFGVPLHLIWYSYVLIGIASLVAAKGFFTLPTALIHWQSAIHPLIILLVLPNLLRQFCLHFITSNMHYYGDVERGNVFQQTQVLNAWWTWPFQLFCFNFGSTHSIHHYVVDDPFYLRQLMVRPTHNLFKKYGVRFNDTGTFARANRYGTGS